MADTVRNSITPLCFVHAAIGPALLPIAVLHLLTVDKLKLTRIEDVIAKALIDIIGDLAVIDRLLIHHRREFYFDWVIRKLLQ